EPRPRPGQSVCPQLDLDDAVWRDAQNSPGSVFSRRHHTLHGLLAQVVRKGTVGQGRGEVLPRPINTTTEHWSLQTHDWYWVVDSAHAEDTSSSPHWWLQKVYKPHHLTCFLF
ncbi:mCG145917, isoform CRA_a, partial [Mus musculus]